MSEFCLIYTTLPNQQAAKTLGEDIIQKRLAACANIFPSMYSIYEWDSEYADEAETMMILKTRRALVPQLKEEVERLHPYDTPAVLVIPIEDGSQGYLDWVRQQTS